VRRRKNPSTYTEFRKKKRKPKVKKVKINTDQKIVKQMVTGGPVGRKSKHMNTKEVFVKFEKKEIRKGREKQHALRGLRW